MKGKERKAENPINSHQQQPILNKKIVKAESVKITVFENLNILLDF